MGPLAESNTISFSTLMLSSVLHSMCEPSEALLPHSANQVAGQACCEGGDKQADLRSLFSLVCLLSLNLVLPVTQEAYTTVINNVVACYTHTEVVVFVISMISSCPFTTGPADVVSF